MKKLSVAIATFNEENNIDKCLRSIHDWIDEIVIVDGSSTDNTVGIAQKYHAKVIITDNPPIFHINKQKAIDTCSGKWILQLDADEVVSQELAKEIQKAIENKDLDGYWIPRKNYFLGKFLTKGGQYPDYTLRLYRKGKGRLPCKSIHEQTEVTGKLAKLVNPLFHYNYPDFQHYLEHFNLYTDIFAQELETERLKVGIVSFINYFIFKPFYWFILTFIRHQGVRDGFAGFVFSFFSSLRYPTAYIKCWEKQK